MKSYIKLVSAVIAVLALLLAGADIILDITDKGAGGRPYRVEAQRIAGKLEREEQYSLDDYSYITNVQKMPDGFIQSDSDYLVIEINGVPYRFDYSYHYSSDNTVLIFNCCFIILAALLLGILLYIWFKIIRPFEKISDYPAELAKGKLTVPLKAQKGGYFGKFLWGLDLLRENSEKHKQSELELQKQKKTMIMSLSHDIKTPLGVIELYAKALEKGLYKDESKKKEISINITAKCEEIRCYVDDIAKTSSEELSELDVKEGEFYLSELMDRIRSFYTEKLNLLKTEFTIDKFTDSIIGGDCDRAEEVLQNIIENAIKYGDGKSIAVSFSKEEDCKLIRISNSGCKLSESELPHIFDSFWRGSNVGTQSGSGLGLYICRSLMRKMNGDIFAEIHGDEMSVTAVFSMM